MQHVANWEILQILSGILVLHESKSLGKYMLDIAETAVTMMNNNIVVNIEQCAHQTWFNPVFINIARAVSSSVVHFLPGTSVVQICAKIDTVVITFQ